MNSSLITLVLLITAGAVQACHHDKEDFPPDDSSEFENGGLESRRKRSLRAVDVDPELSTFFTRCMHEKTGSFFPSWKSVVDFVLRDTRWYSASDEQYCPENSNRDPNSVSCWQGRLEKLVRLDSRLLPKAKECIQEFQWSQDDKPFIIRGKRQAHGSSGKEPCLGISLSKYSSCVQDNLLTRSNLIEYPSLAKWDGKSVEQFVLEHFSDCRLTARYTSRGNVYTETCPNRHMLTPPKCLSTIYGEILRSSSPLAGSSSTCTDKYTIDRCKNIRCYGPNNSCDKKTGQCVCDAGYQMNTRGYCVLIPTNPCDVRQCGVNERCVALEGVAYCVCKTGYERLHGECTGPDPCKGVYCGTNARCVNQNNRAVCVCNPGFTLVDGSCQRSNPCDSHSCPKNMECYLRRRNPRCRCLSGYVRSPQGPGCVQRNPCGGVCPPNSACVSDQCVCVEGYRVQGQRCVPIDPCADMRCWQHSTCIRGQCICNTGYERKSGTCVLKDPCEGAQCPPNMRCRPDSDGLPECVCKSGFVRNRGGSPGCMPPDPCDGRTCPPNSGCIAGQCVCLQDFEKNAQGRCVRKNPCRGVSCPPDKVCRRRGSNHVCVCRQGLVDDGIGCRRPTPCDGVTCPANSECVGGQCVCSSGFDKTSDGQCQPTDPCAAVQCGPTTFCDGGVCVCRPGFRRDSSGNCIEDDICDGFCSRNEKCTVISGRPRCDCLDGFQRNQFGECLDFDPCKDVICDANMECLGGGCFCLDGFIKSVQNPGCERRIIDLCEDVFCPPRSKCEEGTCVCEEGLVQNPSGFCIPPQNGCVDIQCEQNMECVNGACQCLPNFVPAPEGPGCVSSTGQWLPWGAWTDCSATCGKGSQMRFRQCGGGMSCSGQSVQDIPCNDITCRPSTDDPCTVGLPGAHRLDNGTCIVCPPEKTFNQCPPACYETCGGPPPDPTVCFSVCRENVFCECRNGYVEKNITDSTCVRRQDCPVWGEWSDWVRCTESCGGGVQIRSRTCNSGNCEGGNRETRPCNTHRCGTSGSCEEPKVFVPCPTRCPKTCGNRGMESACEINGCRQDTQCVCPEGMVETSVSDTTCVIPNECPGLCFPNPCMNDGQCVPLGARYRCVCKPPYSGRNCEIG